VILGVVFLAMTVVGLLYVLSLFRER